MTHRRISVLQWIFVVALTTICSPRCTNAAEHDEGDAGLIIDPQEVSSTEMFRIYFSPLTTASTPTFLPPRRSCSSSSTKNAAHAMVSGVEAFSIQILLPISHPKSGRASWPRTPQRTLPSSVYMEYLPLVLYLWATPLLQMWPKSTGNHCTGSPTPRSAIKPTLSM